MAQSNDLMNQYVNVSDRYQVIERISRGSYGDVMMARDVKTNQKVAIKVIELLKSLENDDSKKLKEEIKNEAAFLSRMDHPNILKYHKYFQYSQHLYIVSEYCEETLTNVLRTHTKDNTRPCEQLIIEFFKLSQGLKYLHDRNIVHKEIKPTNILFKNSEIKIADFGESRLRSQATMAIYGTQAYMSPEMLRYERFNEKTDIWSLGCVFYEIYHLEKAFDEKDLYELRNNILNRRIRHLNSGNTDIANLIDM